MSAYIRSWVAATVRATCVRDSVKLVSKETRVREERRHAANVEKSHSKERVSSRSTNPVRGVEEGVPVKDSDRMPLFARGGNKMQARARGGRLRWQRRGQLPSL